MGDDCISSRQMSHYEEEKGNNKIDEKVYVAVSKEFKACKSTVVWALQNTQGKKLCLVHVHQPAQTISILGGKFPLSSLSEEEVTAHLQKERRQMCKVLDDYLRLCTIAGVQGEKLYIEMRTVENGLVELITQNKIERLVMGAAADNRYSRKMMEPKSTKANYVREHAPDFCHIWFVCKNRLIYTREGTKTTLLSYKNEDKQSPLQPRLTQSSSGWSANLSRVGSEESFNDVDQSSTFSLSHLSVFSKSSETATESTSVPLSRTVDCETPLRTFSLPSRPEEKRHYSPSSNLLVSTELQADIRESIHDQLDQALADVEIAKQETFRESYRRHQAEKEATDAIIKANAAENSYQDELRKRKKLEDELAKTKEELANTKKQRDKALEELQDALNHNSMLKSRSKTSDIIGEELEDKVRSTLELVQRLRQL